MKKILLMFFFISSITVVSADFSEINTFSINVKERSIINKREKKKEYMLLVKFPDKVYKEMKKPNINNGEIYVYNGNKKTIYIPALKQKNTKEIEEDENFIISVMKDIKNIDYSKSKNGIVETKDAKFKVDIKSKKVIEVEYKDGIKVVFENYKAVSEYNFPFKVTIYDSGIFASQLEFTDVKINNNIKDEIFLLK
jgi:outer membrane lipoprotein-sorting protein